MTKYEIMIRVKENKGILYKYFKFNIESNYNKDYLFEELKTKLMKKTENEFGENNKKDIENAKNYTFKNKTRRGGIGKKLFNLEKRREIKQYFYKLSRQYKNKTETEILYFASVKYKCSIATIRRIIKGVY